MTAEIHRKMSEGNFHETVKKYPQYRWLPAEDFSTQYGIMLLEEKSPMDGIPELIKEIEDDCRLFLVTSGYETPIRSFLKKYDLLEKFEEVLGAETHQSKSRKFQMIFERWEAEPGDAIFVTDTLGDIREANEVGLASIAFAGGLHSRELLEKGKPWAIADTAPEVFAAIRRYFSLPD